MISLLGNFWDSLINGIRNLDGTLRGLIMLGLVMLTFFFLALSINKGKNHAEHPIKWGFLILSIVCFVFAIVMTIIV